MVELCKKRKLHLAGFAALRYVYTQESTNKKIHRDNESQSDIQNVGSQNIHRLLSWQINADLISNRRNSPVKTIITRLVSASLLVSALFMTTACGNSSNQGFLNDIDYRTGQVETINP